MGDAQVGQAICPPLQLAATQACEGHVIEAGAALVKGVARRLGVGVQAEQLPSRQGVDRVVERSTLLVFVENRLRAKQRRVPLRTALSKSVTVTAMCARDGKSVMLIAYLRRRRVTDPAGGVPGGGAGRLVVAAGGQHRGLIDEAIHGAR